jgi:hypothetical protein
MRLGKVYGAAPMGSRQIWLTGATPALAGHARVVVILAGNKVTQRQKGERLGHELRYAYPNPGGAPRLGHL